MLNLFNFAPRYLTSILEILEVMNPKLESNFIIFQVDWYYLRFESKNHSFLTHNMPILEFYGFSIGNILFSYFLRAYIVT